MKAIYMLFLIVFVSTNSCSKNKLEAREIKSEIEGQWELSIYACGECNTGTLTYPQGNGNTIGFTKGGRFLRRLKDSLIFEGQYEIVTRKECSKTGDLALQTNEAPFGFVRFISLENETLQLATPSCYSDLSISIYKRVE